mmetsp:Transcript_9405/g.6770  ORF Transcript_9405/g.6770 Transcript_9405/m.6770 type:complete len:113 (+) Transcript_9405:3-341(+)
MIKDILAHSYTPDSFNNTFTSHGSSTSKTLFGKTGDINKNNDRLKFALISIRFPTNYDEERALDGHPTIFLKIIHYAVFGYSPIVKSHLFVDNSVDRDVVHLNDYKFMQKTL